MTTFPKGTPLDAIMQHVSRPWMTALEQRLSALSLAEEVLRLDPAHYMAKRWSMDVEALRAAETFDWAPTPMHACITASSTLPHDTMSLQLSMAPPVPAGWWWFQEPMNVRTLTNNDQVVALLWKQTVGWTNPREATRLLEIGEPGSVVSNPRWSFGFTAFVMDNWLTQKGSILKPVATTSWRWFEGETLHDMMARSSAEYRIAYGPKGRFEGNEDVLGEKGTLLAVAKLSMFFLAACAWLDQKILTEGHGHVERHARKRAEREHKATADRVRVIQLRRVERHNDNPESASQSEVEWTCQWVVSGHWRHQPVGPGRKERKLIYIMPFVKGPEDKPLREAPRKVYEVDR